MTHVAVVGGGIAGLAAAWFLCRGDDGIDVTLLERDDRLGGKIRTTDFAGRPVEEGPDAFLARVPAARDLCVDVGLGDELVSPATGRAYIWTKGALHPIPEGTVLGVPSGLRSITAAGMLSPQGKARAALEPLLPRRRPRGDVSVGRLIAGRFGRELHELLVDPLVGGINAGRTEGMSLDVCAAQLGGPARSRTSVMSGVRAQLRAAPPPTEPPAPVFHAVRGGLTRLVTALADGLAASGADIRLGTAVTGLARAASRWTVATAGGGAVEADAVIIAVPAYVATVLLSGVSRRAARMIGGIEHASVALVTLAFPKAAIDPPLGSGFLVPRPDGRLMTACTVVTAKWPELDRGDDVVVRLSTGRFGDERALGLDDTALVGRLAAELTDAIPVRAEPTAARVSRWMQAFPQFGVGHLDMVGAVEAELERDAPGLALAGAPYRGVGIPACITTARAAADKVRAALDAAN